MAIVWTGFPTTDTVRICYHAESAGVVVRTVLSTGASQTWTSDADYYNNGCATFTGLSAGSEYHYSVYADDVLVYASDYPARTIPTDRAWKIAVISCMQYQALSPVAKAISNDPDIYIVFAIGDTPYADQGTGKWGVTFNLLSTDYSFANWVKTYEAWHRNPWIEEMGLRKGLVRTWSDHEWKDSIKQSAETPEERATAIAALTSWCVGNPPNTDVGIDSDAVYCRGNVNDVVEFFVLDTISYASDFSLTDTGDKNTYTKTMLGLTQRDWLKDGITDSTAGIKFVLSPSMTGAWPDNHAESWKNFQNEEMNIRDVTSVVTTTAWLSGDYHHCMVRHSADPWHLDVNGCPAHVGVFHDVAAYTDDLVWLAAGGLSADCVYGFTTVEFSADGQQANIVCQDIRDRAWRGSIRAGANELIENVPRIGA